MKPIFTNTNQTIIPPPAGVINTFIHIYPPSYTEEILYKTFRLAVIGGLDENSHSISINEVALHIDQLIGLVKAIHAQHQDSRATPLITQPQEDSHD